MALLKIPNHGKGIQSDRSIGCPIVNCEIWRKKDDGFINNLDNLRKLADMAAKYGVTLCCKAHVGAAIWNTPTTLKLLEAIDHPNFGLDMDPSHIYRAGENPVDAIAAVISRIKHVHIRDCKGRQQNPGLPHNQANGRGDIDLLGYIRVLRKYNYRNGRYRSRGTIDNYDLHASQSPQNQETSDRMPPSGRRHFNTPRTRHGGIPCANIASVASDRLSRFGNPVSGSLQ